MRWCKFDWARLVHNAVGKHSAIGNRIPLCACGYTGNNTTGEWITEKKCANCFEVIVPGYWNTFLALIACS